MVKRLRKVDLPIISISHTPLDLGRNICIGKQKRSWHTLYRQLHLGLQAAETRFIHIAEHDCLYSAEHFAWTPPSDNIFYYNENVKLLQWTEGNYPELKGMFSHWKKRRLALSQLVCNRELYLNTLEQRLKILSGDESLLKTIDHVGEPGVSKINLKRAKRWANSGRPVYIKDFLGRVLELEKYETFVTNVPNIDIRHDRNFTGPRRGGRRSFRDKYWGTLEEIKNEAIY